MDRDQLVRDDFPKATDGAGFDIDSVKAHLEAVAAQVAALEARISALEVERNKLQADLADARSHEDGPSGLPEPGPDPLANIGHEIGDAPREVPSAEPEPEKEASVDSAPVQGEDESAARLLATKLAMDGKSRDTIVMQLAAEHEISDPGALVDDVLARLA